MPTDRELPETLFDHFDRTDYSPAAGGESAFQFLNRVDGAYWDQIRNLIERWYARYPAEVRLDLRGRLRSDDNDQHAGAAWELYLHAVFANLDYSLVVHPSLDDQNARPDFLVSKGAQAFYLEAVTLLEAEAESQAEARVSLVYDAINRKVHHDRFYLAIEQARIGRTQPRLKALFAQLNHWLRILDYDALVRLSAQPHRLPTTKWSGGDWSFTFRVLPIRPDRPKSNVSRIIGIEHARGRMVNDHEVIGDRLRRKVRKYGPLTHPFIIALNYRRWTASEDQLQKALFGYLDEGSEGMRTGTLPDHWPTSLRGLWTSRAGPKETSLTGVLCVEHFTLARPTEFMPTLWLNPWADSTPMTVPPFTIVHIDQHTGIKSIIKPKVATRTLIGVDSTWPRAEPFPD